MWGRLPRRSLLPRPTSFPPRSPGKPPDDRPLVPVESLAPDPEPMGTVAPVVSIESLAPDAVEAEPFARGGCGRPTGGADRGARSR